MQGPKGMLGPWACTLDTLMGNYAVQLVNNLKKAL